MLGKSWVFVRLAGIAIVFLSFIGTTESRHGPHVLKEVEPNRAGIIYDKYHKKVNSKEVYLPGRYQVGVNETFLKFRTSEQRIEFSDDDFALGDAIHPEDSDGNHLEVHISVNYKLQRNNVGRLYNAYKMNYEKIFVEAIEKEAVPQLFTKFKQEDYYGDDLADQGTQFQNKKKMAKELLKGIDKMLDEKYYANCLYVEIIWIKLSYNQMEAIQKKKKEAAIEAKKKSLEDKKASEEDDKKDEEDKKAAEDKKAQEEKDKKAKEDKKEAEEKRVEKEKKAAEEKKVTEEKKSEDEDTDEKYQEKIEEQLGEIEERIEELLQSNDNVKEVKNRQIKLEEQDGKVADEANKLRTDVNSRDHPKYHLMNQFQLSKQLKAQKLCQEAIKIEMFKNRNCFENFQQNSDPYTSFSQELASMTGSCQDLSKYKNGKEHLLSSYVQCDNQGYTTTTFFGSSRCHRQESREYSTSKKVETRGEWTKCKQQSTMLAEAEKVKIHKIGAFYALKASIVAFIALSASQFF